MNTVNAGSNKASLRDLRNVNGNLHSAKTMWLYVAQTVSKCGPRQKSSIRLMVFILCPMADRFSGEVNVTNTNADSADLTWQPGPGNISHYRLEVNKIVIKNKTEELSHHLVDLIPGTRYSVQVFPVKCERDLNPQEKVFYTSECDISILILRLKESDES